MPSVTRRTSRCLISSSVRPSCGLSALSLFHVFRPSAYLSSDDLPFFPVTPPYLFVLACLFLVLHVLFGPVCFVSVRTFLVLAGVPVRSPSLYIYNFYIQYNQCVNALALVICLLLKYESSLLLPTVRRYRTASCARVRLLFAGA